HWVDHYPVCGDADDRAHQLVGTVREDCLATGSAGTGAVRTGADRANAGDCQGLRLQERPAAGAQEREPRVVASEIEIDAFSEISSEARDPYRWSWRAGRLFISLFHNPVCLQNHRSG